MYVWCEVGNTTCIKAIFHHCSFSSKLPQFSIINFPHIHRSASRFHSASLVNVLLLKSVLLSFNNCVFIVYFCTISSIKLISELLGSHKWVEKISIHLCVPEQFQNIKLIYPLSIIRREILEEYLKICWASFSFVFF